MPTCWSRFGQQYRAADAAPAVEHLVGAGNFAGASADFFVVSDAASVLGDVAGCATDAVAGSDEGAMLDHFVPTARSLTRAIQTITIK